MYEQTQVLALTTVRKVVSWLQLGGASAVPKMSSAWHLQFCHLPQGFSKDSSTRGRKLAKRTEGKNRCVDHFQNLVFNESRTMALAERCSLACRVASRKDGRLKGKPTELPMVPQHVDTFCVPQKAPVGNLTMVKLKLQAPSLGRELEMTHRLASQCRKHSATSGP